MEDVYTSTYNPENGIYSSNRPIFDIPNTTLIEFFNSQTSDPRIASKIALIDASSGRTVTYAALKERVSTISRSIVREFRIQKGDVILILSPNSIRFVESFLAVISAGAILTTVNPLNTATEIEKQAKDSSPVLVFATKELVCKVRNLQLPIVVIDDETAYNRLLELPTRNSSKKTQNFEQPTRNLQNFEQPRKKSDDRMQNFHSEELVLDQTAALLYSSGTTGASKGVMLTHKNFISAAQTLNVDATLEGRTGEDVILCMLPMFHIFGLAVVVYSYLQRGDTIILMKKFDFIDMLRCIQQYRVTQLPLVPPVVINLAKHASVEDYDLSSLKNVVSGAAPLGKEIMLGCSKRLPLLDLRQGYGLTESSGMGLVTKPRENIRFLGSAGSLIARMEAMVVDPHTSKPLPPNTQGELWLRGPHIMKGYLNNPEATAATVDRDGWLHTGDLVYINKGRFYIVDRLKELIKYKGFQVAPAELEALLLSHPMVLDAAVVPLPDDEAGQVPIAYVVKKPNTTVDELSILNFVAKQVAPYKKLKRVVFIDEIPKSAAGKILRRELTKLTQSKL